MCHEETLSWHDDESDDFIDKSAHYEFNNDKNITSIEKRILSWHKVTGGRKKDFDEIICSLDSLVE